MRKLTIALLLILISLAGAGLGLSAAPQDEDQPDTHVACDNSHAKDTQARWHNCQCERAAEKCDPNDPHMKDPSSLCKKSCHPEMCDCQNHCTS